MNLWLQSSIVVPRYQLDIFILSFRVFSAVQFRFVLFLRNTAFLLVAEWIDICLQGWLLGWGRAPSRALSRPSIDCCCRHGYGCTGGNCTAHRWPVSFLLNLLEQKALSSWKYLSMMSWAEQKLFGKASFIGMCYLGPECLQAFWMEFCDFVDTKCYIIPTWVGCSSLSVKGTGEFVWRHELLQSVCVCASSLIYDHVSQKCRAICYRHIQIAEPKRMLAAGW